MEQDYSSDKDVVQGAKNRLRREYKNAIEEYVGNSQNNLLDLERSIDSEWANLIRYNNSILNFH